MTAATLHGHSRRIICMLGNHFFRQGAVRGIPESLIPQQKPMDKLNIAVTSHKIYYDIITHQSDWAVGMRGLVFGFLRLRYESVCDH